MCTTRSWAQILSSHNVSVMILHDVSVIMTLRLRLRREHTDGRTARARFILIEEAFSK